MSESDPEVVLSVPGVSAVFCDVGVGAFFGVLGAVGWFS